MRTSPIDGKRRLHAGIDMAIATGTLIQTSNDGIVSRSGPDPVYGLVVVVDHGGGYSTLYAHNSRLEVKEGEPVRQGQELSRSGSWPGTSGRTSC